jgi:hypothetical protein
MSGVLPSTDKSVLITCGYNDDVYGDPGLVWVILHDNDILGWTVGEPVVPIILGSLPPAAPATDPILSPVWAQYSNGTVFVPDLWRGALAAFFTHIATNNGAQRKVYANFYTSELASAWRQWAGGNPLALSKPPNVALENTALPVVTQNNDLLTCTEGTWAEPVESYAYQWKRDTTDIGTGSANYVVTGADVGKTLSCVVTATVANGVAGTATSNGVVVTTPSTMAEPPAEAPPA